MKSLQGEVAWFWPEAASLTMHHVLVRLTGACIGAIAEGFENLAQHCDNVCDPQKQVERQGCIMSHGCIGA